MFVEALEYPFEGADTLRTFLVGGVLYLLSPFVLPLVVLGGYSVAVVRDVAADRSGPPPFDDLEAFARDGLSVVAISLVYWLPGLVLGGIVVGAYAITIVVAATGSSSIGVAPASVTAVGAIVGTVYTLAVAYLLPAAVANFARTSNLGAAWDVDVLGTIATDRAYATAWTVAAIVLVIAITVGGALTAILVGFLVFFYGQVVATFLYARGSVEALDEAIAPQTSPSSSGEGSTSDSDDQDADAASDSDAPAEDSDGTGPADESQGGGGDGGMGGRGGGDGDTGTDSEGDDAGQDAGTIDELTDVAGVGPATAESLRDAGYETVDDLRSVTREDLAAVAGIGPAKADQIKRDVDD